MAALLFSQPRLLQKMQELAGGLAIFGAGYHTNEKMQVAARMRYQMGSTGIHIGIHYKKLSPPPLIRLMFIGGSGACSPI